jgi:hypothetical protein
MPQGRNSRLGHCESAMSTVSTQAGAKLSLAPNGSELDVELAVGGGEAAEGASL